MERAEITDANKPLKVTKSPVPAPPPKGARLKTVYAGVCHSDIHIIEDFGEYLPGIEMTRRDVYKKLGKNFSGIVPGHEIAGIIEEFGNCTHPDEYGLAVGDFVVLLPWVGCGDCDTCSRGINNECTKNPKLIHSYGISPSNAGGYSSHVLAHKLDILVKIPNSIPKHVAAMLPCSGLTVFTSLKKAANSLTEGYKRNKSAKLLIVGSGGLGQWCIQLATLMFSHVNIEITVADISSHKLQIAKELGSKSTVLWQTTYKGIDEQLADVHKTTKNGEYKFDAAIDFVGMPNTFALAHRSLRPAGSLISVGLFGGEAKLSLLELVRTQYKIQGSNTGTLTDLKELVNFLKDKDVNYSNTEFVALQEINETLDRLKEGKILGRALIKFKTIISPSLSWSLRNSK